MKVGIWLAIIAASVLLAVLEGYCSYKYDRSFWPSQVWEHWHTAGIPLSMHGGWISDLVILPTAFAIIVWYRAETWSPQLIAAMAAIGFLVSLGNHLLLITGQPIPDPFGWVKFKWSAAIAMHFVYFAVYTMLIGLSFWSKLPVLAVVAVAVLIGVHCELGMHVVLGIVQRRQQWKEVADLIASPNLPWMSLGVWLVLAGLTTYAANWRAGTVVLGIGLFLACIVVMIVRVSPPPLNA